MKLDLLGIGGASLDAIALVGVEDREHEVFERPTRPRRRAAAGVRRGTRRSRRRAADGGNGWILNGFIDRVATMHASWVERRYLKHIAADHTFEPQFELLRRLHEWAIGAVTDTREVFGEALSVEVYPAAAGDLDRNVQVVVGGSYSLGFSLIESYDPRQANWRVTAAARLPGGPSDVAVKPHRQVGMWTRREFEDALLTLLAAYERDRFE